MPTTDRNAIWRLAGLVLLVLSLAGCAAQGPTTQVLGVDDPWARPGEAGSTSAVYFTLTNANPQEDLLLSAESQVAASTELHRSTMSEGVMRMEPQENVPLPANGEVAFEPGGLHVMLVDLADGLEVGETFPLTLTLQEAGEFSFEVTVREP